MGTIKRLTHDSFMPGGIHSNKQMKYVPAKYLLYLYRNNMCSDQVKDYVSRYMDELQREVKTDGGWLRGREDQVSAQAEIIFEQLAKQNMLRFDLNQFKQDYPSLFKVIIDTAVKLKTTQP